ncbi:5782_t:CDS:2, partial [Ambispora leptoticha]
FVRVAPFFPNWFVNIASPHLEVSLNVFFWATLVGVAPLSFIHVQAGETIRITGTEDVSFFTPRNLVSMSLIAVAAFISAYIRRKYSNKLRKLE